MHVDLCFVPWVDGVAGDLPAVSGSSGRLIPLHSQRGSASPSWAGQVFQQPDVPFEDAMRWYAQATADRLLHIKAALVPLEGQKSAWREGAEARAERHALLERRRKEDAAWCAQRGVHHADWVRHRAMNRAERAAYAPQWEAQQAEWAQHKQAHAALLDQRQGEDRVWHERNRARTGQEETVWIAILVVTDDATRRCWGLPVFASGAHVTAREVADALRTVLPEGLAFLISDQGLHFRSAPLAQLASECEFVHVVVYRHRPQTNGIAERFVRTLKYELKDQSWSGPEELSLALHNFLLVYNDRPHQGLPIPGLSPTEFAARLWLL